jgi:hypothetical protein
MGRLLILSSEQTGYEEFTSLHLKLQEIPVKQEDQMKKYCHFPQKFRPFN